MNDAVEQENIPIHQSGLRFGSAMIDCPVRKALTAVRNRSHSTSNKRAPKRMNMDKDAVSIVNCDPSMCTYCSGMTNAILAAVPET